jgi:hypothetical protein
LPGVSGGWKTQNFFLMKADVLPRAKFCGECGIPLSGQPAAPPAPHLQLPVSYILGHSVEKILTSKTALEGEREQVTVLFADLEGSMGRFCRRTTSRIGSI